VANKYKKKGFTLIELLLVIAISIVIIGAVFTVQGRVLTDTYLDTSTSQVEQSLRLAQMRAMSRFHDTSWGVYFDATGGEYVLFNGTTYAGRDASFDITSELPSSVSIGGLALNGGATSVIFDELSGETSDYGYVRLASTNGDVDDIYINAKGVISGSELTGGGAGGGGGDTTAPAAVSDLAVASPTTTSLDVSWTAPGDDGAVGTATTYDLRYSTSTINEANWATATEVTGEPTPSVAGTSESMTVNGLTEGTTYYFALKTSDEVPNESSISNVATGDTVDIVTESDYFIVDYSGVYVGGGGNKDLLGITLENTGTSNITIVKMTLTWTSGNMIKEVDFNGTSVWKFNGVGTPDGQQISGTELDIVDYVLTASTVVTPNTFSFSGNVSGVTFQMDFEMSDGSTKTVTPIQP
jgi:prepilin-type N-terminal cleavage/methylation domain-containing protein